MLKPICRDVFFLAQKSESATEADKHTLEQYRGKRVILYFYPKDNTAGCTKQACGFSERYPQFQEKGAVVLGVSKDSVKSHKNFKTKYSLAFPILSDPELTCIKAYDVWQEKRITERSAWA